MSILLFNDPTVPPAPPPPNPTTGGLTPSIWLAGDRIGGQSGGNPSVTVWSEEGTLNAMTQFNLSLQPTITPSGLNNLPTVHFGLGQNLSATETNIEYIVPWTLCAVVKTGGHITLANLSTATGPATVFFDLNGTTLSAKIQHSNTQLVNVTWPCAGTWNVISIVYLGNGLANGLSAYVNGTLQTPTVVSDTLGGLTTNADSPWYVGSPGSFTGGEVAEILLFMPLLTTIDRQTIETYLNNKWFVVPTPTPPGTGIYGTAQETINLTQFPIQAPFDQNQ